MRALVFVMLVACGSKPAPAPEPPQRPVVEPTTPERPPEPPARVDFAVGESPVSLVVNAGALVWTDGAGAIWTQPIDPPRGTPAQLSDQHSHGFMFHPVVAGGSVFVSTKRDFVRVDATRVTKLGLALPEDPEQVVADDQAIYVTLFKRDDVMAVPLQGGAPKRLFKFKRGVLAVHGGTLYAVSYANGTLVAVPTSGGTPRTIAKGFVRATALAVDDTHAFIYGEKDKTLRKVELATRATSVLATGLDNSDDLISDGAWLYAYSWPSTLLRIAKDGSGQTALADDLKSPTHIAVDADAVYVVSRDQNEIVRLRKR